MPPLLRASLTLAFLALASCRACPCPREVASAPPPAEPAAAPVPWPTPIVILPPNVIEPERVWIPTIRFPPPREWRPGDPIIPSIWPLPGIETPTAPR